MKTVFSCQCLLAKSKKCHFNNYWNFDSCESKTFWLCFPVPFSQKGMRNVDLDNKLQKPDGLSLESDKICKNKDVLNFQTFYFQKAIPVC